MKSTCLVIGGSGFLGRETVPALSERYHVLSTGRREHGPDTLALDLRDADAVARVVHDLRPAAVVALAAYRDPDACEDAPEETRRLNTEPYRVLTRLLAPETPLVFVSTDYVFDGDHPPYHEHDERRPVNVYGESKRDAEDSVASFPGGVIVRVPLLMGWTADPGASGFFSQLIGDLRAREPRLLDDTLARRPTWTRDAARAIARLLCNHERGMFHFSTSRRWTRYQAAVEMAGIMGWPHDHCRPSDAVVPRRARRPRDAQLAMSAWSARGYPPPLEFPGVAREFVRAFAGHPFLSPETGKA